ncbi:glycerate kinase [Gemella sp. oral taxon 928]|uniref:glycerate kinase n=1 Tax=Gemella sp. oral taxon 928 TaxID=1785995 RepID=UPI000A826C96|nr:glycerate kinase [Gemella sp. oral taxon 928]
MLEYKKVHIKGQIKMKVMIAMNEFKGCLTSKELSLIIEKTIKNVNKKIDIVKEVIADGGDGFLDIFENFDKKTFTTVNAIGEKTEVKYLVNHNTKEAVIEVAEIVGIRNLSKKECNPYKTTTYGLGILINTLLYEGIKTFTIGLGGSATNDCGIGMLSALGIKFYDENNNLCVRGISELKNIVKIDDTMVSKYLKYAKFNLICDVENPLYGKNGATYIFGGQKGLDERDFSIVDDYVKNFSKVVYDKYKKDFSIIKGSGAAGGLAYAFLNFTNSKMFKGSEYMINYLDIENKIRDIDVLITGEGCLDKQSFMGKAPIELAKIAKKNNKKVIFLAGSITDDELEQLSENNKELIDASFTIQRGVISIREALDKKIATKNIEKTIEQIFCILELFSSEV